uniref:Uncharacterized protein n=1 Tax=Anguilla anguilla TaxID=7936 RepID=A0A0E9Q1U4_ANGAN
MFGCWLYEHRVMFGCWFLFLFSLLSQTEEINVVEFLEGVLIDPLSC